MEFEYDFGFQDAAADYDFYSGGGHAFDSNDADVADNEFIFHRHMVADNEFIVSDDLDDLIFHRHKVADNEFIVSDDWDDLKFADNEFIVSDDWDDLISHRHKFADNEFIVSDDLDDLISHRHKVADNEFIVSDDLDDLISHRHKFADNEFIVSDDWDDLISHRHKFTDNEFIVSDDSDDLISHRLQVADNEFIVSDDSDDLISHRHKFADNEFIVSDDSDDLIFHRLQVADNELIDNYSDDLDDLIFHRDQDPSVPYDFSIHLPFIQDLTESRSRRTGVPYVVEKDVIVKETQSLTESDNRLNTYAAASSESRPRAPEVLQRQNKDGCVKDLTASRSRRTGVPHDLSIYERFIQDLTASMSHGVPYGVEKDVTVKETQILTESDGPPNTYAAASSESRPKAVEVLQLPIMSWSSKEISPFLCDSSERLKLKHDKNGLILTALERTSKTVFGDECDRWDEKMDPEFIRVICMRRSYNFNSVRALVDAFRNNKIHYLRLPKDIKNLVGPDLYAYFYSKFPELFPEVYKVMLKFCSNEDWFKEYRTGCI